MQADHRTLTAQVEGAAQVRQEQAEIGQALTQGFFQVRLLDQAAANQGEAARGHAVGIQVEEFVVQVTDQQQPEARERRGRHPGRHIIQTGRRNARLLQQALDPLGLRAQPVDHGVEKVDRNRIVFPHGFFRDETSRVWQKMPIALDSFGIGQARCRA
ncbi:hypothetical protein D9M71_349550 [compost metagenome]